MKAWMRRCSMVGLLAAAGCGGPVTGPADAQSDEGALTVTPAAPATNASRAAQAPVERSAPAFTPGQARQLSQAAPRPLELEFEAFNIPNINDGRAHLVVGMMSCGFWQIGQGQALVWGGKAKTQLSLDPSASGAQGFSVYFYVDRDNDGTCSAGDDIYQAPLPALPVTGPVVVDASTLAPTYAGCWLFQL